VFGERRRDASAGARITSEFAVTPTQSLHQRVTAHDDGR